MPEKTRVFVCIFGSPSVNEDFEHIGTIKTLIREVFQNEIDNGKEVILMSTMSRGVELISYYIAKEMGIKTEMYLSNHYRHWKYPKYRQYRRIAAICDYSIGFVNEYDKLRKSMITMCRNAGKLKKVFRFRIVSHESSSQSASGEVPSADD